MQQKTFSISLSQYNPKFIVKDKEGIRLIRITKVKAAQIHSSHFWDMLHLRIADQKELTLFDRPLSVYAASDTSQQEVYPDEQFNVADHITVSLYADQGQAFAAEVAYELGYE